MIDSSLLLPPAAESVANMLKNVRSDRKSRIELLIRQMDEEDAMIDAAYRAIDAAKIAGDMEVYQRAKRMLEDVENSLESTKSRLNELKSSPLISPDRYETVVSVLRKELSTIEDPEDIRKTNDVLHRLQQMFHRDFDNSNLI